MAEAAAAMGREAVMVVHSTDGLDEISPCAPTRAVHIDRSGTRELLIDPQELGIGPCDRREMLCASPQESADLARTLLSGGSETGGTAAAAVLLNAGAALLVAGLAGSLADGLALAREALASGRAGEKVDSIIAASSRISESHRVRENRA
jgi:anthranilate phosphoribosyltransferase